MKLALSVSLNGALLELFVGAGPVKSKNPSNIWLDVVAIFSLENWLVFEPSVILSVVGGEHKIDTVHEKNQ